MICQVENKKMAHGNNNENKMSKRYKQKKIDDLLNFVNGKQYSCRFFETKSSHFTRICTRIHSLNVYIFTTKTLPSTLMRASNVKSQRGKDQEAHEVASNMSDAFWNHFGQLFCQPGTTTATTKT